MDYIKFTSTYKADGKKYEQIVFWNRFLRNKTELILTFLPVVISIYFFSQGYRSTFIMLVYFIFFVYPFLAYKQFKSSVEYHLKHRDPSEHSVCQFTLMDSGILCELQDTEEKKIFKWESFTTVYNRLNYYMFFEKDTMHVMLNQEDIPAESKDDVLKYIKDHINHNKCAIR